MPLFYELYLGVQTTWYNVLFFVLMVYILYMVWPHLHRTL